MLNNRELTFFNIFIEDNVFITKELVIFCGT